MKSFSMEAIDVLKSLIKERSYSGCEDKTATIIQKSLEASGIPFKRVYNNVIAQNRSFDAAKKTVILNSHHDTVKVVDGWSRDPFGAKEEGDQIFGLGSNDAGASLVALLMVFKYFYQKSLDFNLVYIASAEEENFGPLGVSAVLKQLPFNPALAIIGEPTGMGLCIAEKGLIVLDAVVKGQSGHAARDTGINAIIEACKDIEWIHSYRFDRVSEVLGPVKMTVTQFNSGFQHNVVPDLAEYVIDVRVNELYQNREIVDIMQQHCKGQLQPRSMRWQASGINKNHSIVTCARELDLSISGSPTLSDQVHFSCPSVKIGPGQSERSHTADEYIKISEIEEGIQIYQNLLNKLEL